MIGLGHRKSRGIQLWLRNGAQFMLFSGVALGLSNQISKTFLVDVFFTKLALKQRTRCFATAKALHINCLYQLAVRLIRSLFQLVPGQFYIKNGLTAR